MDENAKQKYIEQYYEKEDILLNYSNIKTNSGLRSLVKLMLNSFWGEFGQSNNLIQTTYISDPVEFFDMIQKIKNVQLVKDESVKLDWVYNDDFIETSGKTNVIIAAYIRAQARLKLFIYLQPLGRMVLYCDTDSVVFTTCPGRWEPPLSDYLGDLTDEVPNNTILNCVTGGPKKYA